MVILSMTVAVAAGGGGIVRGRSGDDRLIVHVVVANARTAGTTAMAVVVCGAVAHADAVRDVQRAATAGGGGRANDAMVGRILCR